MAEGTKIKQVKIGNTTHKIDAKTVDDKGVHTTFNAADNNNFSTDKAIADYIASIGVGDDSRIGFITLFANSGTLTTEQYAQVQKDICGAYISTKDVWAYKMRSTGSNGEYIFISTNISLDSIQTNKTISIRQIELVVNKSTKAYNVYNKIVEPSGSPDLNEEYNYVYNVKRIKELMAEKQALIDSSHKLSSDLIDDTNNTNKFVTENEKSFIASEYQKTINLFNKFDTSLGGIYYANGITSGDVIVKHSDYIEIKPNTTYKNNMLGGWSSSMGIAFYNSSKTYISGYNSNSQYYTQFTTPNNAKYVRISYYASGSSTTYDTNEDTLMLVEGSTLPSTYIKNYGSIVHKSEIYPVGSIYMSINSISPASFFGGTWERIEELFLYASSYDSLLGQTGGNRTHTHTLNNAYAKMGYKTSEGVLAYREITVTDASWENNVRINGTRNYDNTTYFDFGTGIGGWADEASNVPPNINVAVWKRIA